MFASRGDMKKVYRDAIGVSVSCLGAVCILLVTAYKTLGQSGSRGTPPSSIERREDLSNRQATEYEIERSSRELKKPRATAEDRKHAQDVTEQIKHDFGALQESHNQIVLFMAKKESLNRNESSVLREVAEIRKYAKRLKTNLALPKPKQETSRVESSTEQLEDSLMTLRQHIYNFVTNPLFATAGVLDLEQGRKASLDLDMIITISENITTSGSNEKQPAKP
jgi:hypothetical protein